MTETVPAAGINDTMRTFGHPDTLVAEYLHWVVLLRPQQATLRALRQYQPARCRIQVDGAPFFSGAIFLAAIGNGTTFGRGMRITPQARLDDGLADVVVVPAIGTLRVLLRMPQLYRGTHLEHPSVRYVRGREIRFEPIDPLPPFDLDGETFASGAASWRVRPAALTVAG